MSEQLLAPQNSENTGNEVDESINIQELVMRYFMYWPWIVASVVVALILGWLYIKRTQPVYQVSEALLIKDESNSRRFSRTAGLENLSNIGMISMANNFDNEVQILSSTTLVRHVIEDLDLYISINEKGFFHPTNIYGASPLKIWTTPTEADSIGNAKIEVDFYKDGTADVDITIDKRKVGDELYTYTQHIDKLPAIIPTKFGNITFSRIDSVALERNYYLKASISSPYTVADSYKTRYSVDPVSKTTTIANLTIKDVNRKRGIAFLNGVYNRYNAEANLDKNQIAEKTADFINDRIVKISKELGNTENSMANFKRGAGITDVTADAQIALQARKEYEQKRAENQTQQKLVEYLKDYIQSAENQYEVIPVTVGSTGQVSDHGLSTLIADYNKLATERQRLMRNSTEKSTVIQALNTQLAAMRQNIFTTVSSVEKGISIAQGKLDAQQAKYVGAIASSPEDEKVFLSIAREREFQSQLYLILLQQREENAIKLASTANNGRIIDEARAGRFPIAPRKSLILLVALILGAGIPIGLIYLKDLLSFKIENRGDVQKITKLPIVGDIPFNKETKGVRAIMVRENKNDLYEEIFRSVRTNIQFMLGSGKVVLFTSSVAGEGKSTTAGNLAASYAFLGKKVVVVGLDIRKPGLNKVFKISTQLGGITQYLSNPENTSLLSLVQQTDVSPNLYVLPGGVVPPNPTELVARKSLDDAIQILKDNFDIVILDTAPIGMVTDTQIISRVADMTVYVVRVGYTSKSIFSLINDLNEEKKLPNIGIVINGIDMDRRSSGYYYGYGKYGKYGRYGYGKKYGYGYGYGNAGSNLGGGRKR